MISHFFRSRNPIPQLSFIEEAEENNFKLS